MTLVFELCVNFHEQVLPERKIYKELSRKPKIRIRLCVMTMRENSKPSKKYKTKNYLLGFGEQSSKVKSQFPLTSIPVFNRPL